MPNHITNILTAKGDPEKVAECMAYISGTEKDEDTGRETRKFIDFDRIIPRPKSLDIESSSRVDLAIAFIREDNNYFRKMLEYPWVKNEGITTLGKLKSTIKESLTEKEMELGRIALDNIEKYGSKDWYEWSSKNWGTKWNAYDQHEAGFGSVRFDTAWATPFPVMEKLAKTFPELRFEVIFADEDLGSNCGGYSFKNGELFGEFIPEKGIQAVRFACSVKEFDFTEYVMNAFDSLDLNELKEVENDILLIMRNGDTGTLVGLIGNEDKEGREKMEYLKELAVRHELYEDAGQINDLLSN